MQETKTMKEKCTEFHALGSQTTEDLDWKHKPLWGVFLFNNIIAFSFLFVF